MKAQEETEVISTPSIWGRSVVSFTSRPLYPPGEFQYQLTRNKVERATEPAWTFRCAGNVDKETSNKNVSLGKKKLFTS